ncbi:MAG: homoserine kinase [Acidimicrobiaceae bacterium]|nr:homoserine kinase [Acidimicrobiaceae bacterium]
MTDWSVRVPASSANLGAGFDVLGLALTLHAELGVGPPPDGARIAEPSHPASVAFGRAGGSGSLWVKSPIPMGRGMGFSGAVRVGGCAVAAVQRHGPAALDDPTVLAEICATATELEGHADNVAPSIYGGIVVCADDHVQPVPLGFEPAIVVWVPDGTTTSTDRSRATLAAEVSRSDAVFNLGRVATFVAACAAGDTAALRMATDDRLHQPTRLAAVPETARALDAALDLGAWAAWLSGSGPTMAAMCDPGDANRIAAGLPDTGHTKMLAVDHDGVTCCI